MTTTVEEKRPGIPAAVAVALLVMATLLAYFPALHGGFIFDDNVFLTGNPLIHAPDGLRRLWFSREAADYWPVTSSTLWLEWRLWGLNATGYHATNVVLHIVEVLLLWAVLRRLGLPGSFLAACVFALHPVNAESVAWITERKNLMAMLFYLLSIFCFTGRTRAGYWLSLLAFTLAMLSKGSVVILPLVLLGIVAWDHCPVARDWRRLLPFFLLAAGLALFEAQFSTVLGPAEIQPSSYLLRLLRAGAVVWFYAGKAFWPVNLCFDYGLWHVHPDNLGWWLPLVAAAVTTALLWHYRRSWSRPALFAWGYFCVTLIPVMGLAEVGFMRYSPVSDHFSHLALIGVAAFAGAGWVRLAGEAGGLWRAFIIGATVTVFTLFGILTWRQSRVYSDAGTLYRATLMRNPSSWIAHTNLGVMLYESGQVEPAITHLEEAVWLEPDFAESRNDLGIAFYRAGRLPEAMVQYDEALRLRPDFYQVRNNLGAALARAGRLPEAVEQFEAALRIEPNYNEARFNLARAEEIEDEHVSPAGGRHAP
ncbi:MAG TPA: tetratricopeptide repeat protein [Opitutaceae bacterium]|jgi:hypothetical protein|nr:tetratricopeptide repeat protein [Opitutaceae bacterium]